MSNSHGTSGGCSAPKKAIRLEQSSEPSPKLLKDVATKAALDSNNDTLKSSLNTTSHKPPTSEESDSTSKVTDRVCIDHYDVLGETKDSPLPSSLTKPKSPTDLVHDEQGKPVSETKHPSEVGTTSFPKDIGPLVLKGLPKAVKVEEQNPRAPSVTVCIEKERLLKSGVEQGAKSKLVQSHTVKETTNGCRTSPDADDGTERGVRTSFTKDTYEQVTKTILRKSDHAAKTTADYVTKAKKTPPSEGRRARITFDVIPALSSDSDSDDDSGEERFPCDSSFPVEQSEFVGPLDERLTATVIRRHVKSKPQGVVKQSSSPEIKIVHSPEDHEKSHSPSMTDPQSSESTHSTAQVPKMKSPSSESSASMPSDSAKFKQKQNIGDHQVPPSKRSSENLLKTSNIGEIATFSATKVEKEESTNLRAAKEDQIVEECVGAEGIVPEGAHSNDFVPDPNCQNRKGQGIKHVSIREPPISIPCKSDAKDAQSSKSKTDAKGGRSKESRKRSLGKRAASNDSNEDGKDRTDDELQTDELQSPKNKSCCFCWCCCCSCSCLSVKPNKRNQELKQHQQLVASMENYINGEDTVPSLEEIRAWGESFDRLMKCSAGRKVFREFLQCEYSEENILFWMACEDLKKETKTEKIEEKARVIYEDFISILSPREVSLDSRVRDIINKNMRSPTITTFDEAQLQIYTLMHRDSYPRFVNSTLYRKLAQLSMPVRKGSVV